MRGNAVVRAEPEDWHGARAFALAGGGGEHATIESGEHEVFASIEVTFALERG